MVIFGRIALGLLSGAELCAPAATRLGERLVRFSEWVEERRTRLTILATIAD
jgi:hypothetical protein